MGEFGLKIISRTPGTKAFLRNNPFIFERNGSLQSAIFVDGDGSLSGEDIQRIHKEYSYAGLSRLIVYYLQAQRAPLAGPSSTGTVRSSGNPARNGPLFSWLTESRR
jgi:hypothetical protein